MIVASTTLNLFWIWFVYINGAVIWLLATRKRKS